MIPANFVGLRFLLQHGAFLQVAVHQEEAKKIIHGFIKEELNSIIGAANELGSWSVRVHDVVAIHTIPLEAVQGQQAAPPGVVWRPGLSGI